MVEKNHPRIGATNIDGLRKVFIDGLCWKALQCNVIYEDEYLLGLGPSCHRSRHNDGRRRAGGCNPASHDCTSKGNTPRDNLAHCFCKAGMLEDSSVIGLRICGPLSKCIAHSPVGEIHLSEPWVHHHHPA